MNKKELKEIESILLAEINVTKQSIHSYKELTKPIAPENAIGRVSRMDAINNKSVNEAALKKAEIKLKNLEIAFSNLNDPTFGVCAKCNISIPIGRIMLVPHSRYCVNCAI